MTIKNKRKNRKKYYSSLKGQLEMYKKFRQEQEEKLMYGTYNSFKDTTLAGLVNQIISK